MAGIIVLANLAQVGAQYTFYLIGADDLADNTFWVTVLGVFFIWPDDLRLLPRHRDRATGCRTCWSSIQYIALAILVVVAHRPRGLRQRPDDRHRHPPRRGSTRWSSSDGGGGWVALTEGMILMVFIYWGWDTILSTQRGDQGPREHPGQGRPRLHADPAGDLPPDHGRRRVVRRRRHHRHRAGQRGQRRRRVQRHRRARARATGTGSCCSRCSSRRSPRPRPRSCPPPAAPWRWASTARSRHSSRTIASQLHDPGLDTCSSASRHHHLRRAEPARRERATATCCSPSA